jgi:hypothetical protein
MRTAIVCCVVFLAACGGSPVVRRGAPVPNSEVVPPFETPVAGRSPEEIAAADKVNDERAQKQKELRQKQHELDYSDAEYETSSTDLQARTLGAKAAQAKAEAELAKARTELDTWQKVQRPKEVDDKRLSVDRQTYSAEEAKDELAELEATYQADEFAKTTKELVLKRSRRKLEVSERELALAKKDLDTLSQTTHPQKEKELTRKVTESEAELEKARVDLRKLELEASLAARKAKDRSEDLKRDVQDLKQKLGEGR